MSRTPKPWYRPSRKTWYVTIAGQQHNLGSDKEAAWQLYWQLMAKGPEQGQAPSDQVTAILDKFLDWTEKNRAPLTYKRYREQCQSLIDALPNGIPVSQLKPFHVQQWLDAHPDWNDGNRRGNIVAVQRAFRWAQKMGYIDRSPIEGIEKPRAGRRDEIVTPEEYETIHQNVQDNDFADLLRIAWLTGCRPQEAWGVEASHVDLTNARWVLPPTSRSNKVKTRPRIIYLPDEALAITKRR